MIGRHFLIYSEDLVKIKRQYTICNSISSELYTNLIKLCGDALSGAKTSFNTELLDSSDKNSFYVTFKDY